MCLTRELSKTQCDKIKSGAQKRGYIRVWKVCRNYFGKPVGTTGTVYGLPYKKGLRKAKDLGKTDAGWYAYLTKKAAIKGTLGQPEDIKVCYAKASWIKNLGFHCEREAGIFTHLVFPDWDRGDMTIREFREICRKEK